MEEEIINRNRVEQAFLVENFHCGGCRNVFAENGSCVRRRVDSLKGVELS